MSGIVSAPEPEAVETGVEILRQGGNAVDAAVACALVQGVVDPPMSGIGGWGTLQVYMHAPRAHATIDFYATAPLAARPAMWAEKLLGQTRDGWGFLVRDHENEIGAMAIATPGSLKGYAEAHARFGRLPWAAVVEPAIGFAEDGFLLRPHFHRFLTGDGKHGRAAPRDKMRHSAAARQLFYDGEAARPPGTLLRNPDLGRSLRRIARDGAETFYQGDLAREIVADIRARGGILSLEDLAGYRAVWGEPVRGSYRGRPVATSNPPGGGLSLLEMLNILEGFDLAGLGHNSPAYIRAVAEAMKCAQADKDGLIGDPEFMAVPHERFLDKAHAAAVAARIRAGERFQVARLGGEAPHTTHLSVLDGEGNAVAMTHSLGMVSGVMTDGLGFFYNGAMGVFDPRPGRPGSIAPGKRRYTSACPTMLFEDDRPSIVIGAPGGAHIANAVLQAIVNILDFGMTMQEAVAAPRFSATSDPIDVCNRIPRSVTRALEAEGYRIVRSAKSYDFAEVHGVGRQQWRLVGGADPAADGMALEA